MKIIPCTQGEQDWIEAKIGIPSASNFSKIITPKKREFSASAKPYAYMLVAEKLLNRTLQSLDGLEHIEYGKMHEGDARKMYEFEHGVKTVKVGFITTNDGRAGCSPDSLVGDKGLAEFKCPAPQTMVKYIFEGMDDAYICQKQGQLYVSEREWCDLFAHNHETPNFQKRFDRDEKFISDLAKCLREFHDLKEEVMAKAVSAGLWAAREKYVGIVDDAYAEKIDHLQEAIG